MPESHLTIRYQGASADQHQVDLRDLGRSLVGIERLLAYGLFSMDTGRLPHKREALPFNIHATQAHEGCFEIGVVLTAGAAFAPGIHEMYITGASKVLWTYLSGVFRMTSGDEQASKELVSQALDNLDKSDERRHLEMMELIRTPTIQNHAGAAVAPIGISCDTMIVVSQGQETEIDFAMAEAIRSKGKRRTGARRTMTVVVDGIIHHNRQLRVYLGELEGREGPLVAYVRDSAIKQVPNVYARAAARRLPIVVTARPNFSQDGSVHSLVIFKARPWELGDPDP